MKINVFSVSRCYNSRNGVTHVASSPSVQLPTPSRLCTPLYAKYEKLLRSSTVRSLLSAKHSQRRETWRAASTVASTDGPKVGFIGLGIMGVPMTLNLLKAGNSVTVWNRSPGKSADVEAAGAKVAGSLEELAKESQVIFAMLADPAAALDVAQQLSKALTPGAIYVDVSTVDAGTAQQVAKLVRGAGGRYLEAPVSGSKGPAEQGTLIFLTGGDRDAFDAVSPMLDVMGKAKFFLGEVVNMLMGTMMASFAESLVLAEAAGLSKKDLLEVVGLGAVAAPMYALKGPAMVEGKYPTAFPLKHQRKDMRLALELGETLKQDLSVAAAADGLYVAAQKEGHGDADFSAVLEALTPK